MGQERQWPWSTGSSVVRLRTLAHDDAPLRASKTVFQRSSPGLLSIPFAYLGMSMLETCVTGWDVAAKPVHSTGVPLALEIIFDLPIGFPINNIISLFLLRLCY